MTQPKLNNILFLDIETAPLTYKYKNLKGAEKELWDKKWMYNPDNKPEELYAKAGVYAEFSKIICIGLGYYNEKEFRVKAIAGNDERKLREEFLEIVKTHFNKAEHYFCAHNGKEFDYPFLSRRIVVNGLSFPKNFQRSNPSAVIESPDEVAQNGVRLFGDGFLFGERRVFVDTLCLHGDNKRAAENAILLREVLTKNGIEIAGLK